MRIHREGRMSIALTASVCALALVAVQAGVLEGVARILVLAAFVLVMFVIYFFRHPSRPIPQADPRLVYASADGKVVAIEETLENEFFHERRIQVSIFMSPLNVHVNRVPLPGRITYFKYHPGSYRVAWHPKSSAENEHATYVLSSMHGDVLMRQIAGAVARRIVSYPHPGDAVRQGEELGFIKFGSRFDVLLPLNSEVQVQIGEQVKANSTVIGRLGSTDE